MEAHQERVVVEEKDLNIKIVKLDNFLHHTTGVNEIVGNREELQRLHLQLSIMKSYSMILADRISHF